MVFLNTSNLNPYHSSIIQTVLSCQNIMKKITNGLLHHHGTHKKTMNQLIGFQMRTNNIEMNYELIHDVI